ncbi:MAG: hypothetical protein HY748_03435 [Elusimicrobia bacterium]|nr:hypothetical protein [Elusimicrobiota bacterium]
MASSAPAPNRRPFAALAAAWLLLAGFHLWSLELFPPPNPDESMESSHAYSLLTTGENVYPLFDDIFPPQFAPLAHAYPNVLRPLYNAALASAFRLGGVSLGSGRALSLGFSAAALLLTCWLAWRRTGSWAAVFLALTLLGSNAVFTAGSHDVRPEAMLGFLAVAAYACLDLASHGQAWAVLAGCLAVACVGAHTNGAGVALASVVTLAWTAPRRLPYLALGGFAAGTALLWWVRPDRFLPSWIVFQGFFAYAPPVRTWGWDVFGMAASELNRWIAPSAMGHEPMTRLFSWTLALEWSAVLAVWLAGWRTMKDAASRGLLVWIGTLTAFYAFFFAHKNPQYLSVFEPFLALMLGTCLHRAWREDGPRRLSAGVMLAGAAGAAVLCLASPFLIAPTLWVLALPARSSRPGLTAGTGLSLPVSDRNGTKGRRWEVWLAVLVALLPMFCLRVRAPAVFSASMSLGVQAHGSWLGSALAAAVAAVVVLSFWARRSPAALLTPGWRPAALAAWLGVLVACNAVESVSRTLRAPRFSPVKAELDRLVPREAKVLGPQRLWLALWDRDYRDWNALAYARWLTGDRDVRRYVSAWKPDILIADSDFRRMFLKGGGLAQFCDAPLEPVGVIDFGAGFGQPIEVFRFVRTRR